MNIHFLLNSLCKFSYKLSVTGVGVWIGTEKARAVAQNILDVPYGERDDEKLDVYMPLSSSPGKAMQNVSLHLLYMVSWASDP